MYGLCYIYDGNNSYKTVINGYVTAQDLTNITNQSITDSNTLLNNNNNNNTINNTNGNVIDIYCR